MCDQANPDSISICSTSGKRLTDHFGSEIVPRFGRVALQVCGDQIYLTDGSGLSVPCREMSDFILSM